MDPVGRSIGKYEILRVIGSGGFGTVYEGRDPFIKRRVAVKTCTTGGPEVRDRFFREAEIAGNLHHRNIVTVHDFGVEDEVPYLVQEYLEGEDLNATLSSGRFHFESQGLDVLIQIARGLAHAHEHGVIHRDVKPANVRLLPDGAVKIMDFGIAKLANVESNLTKTGMTLGTAAFLAPEQIRGGAIDQRVDQFSFGVLAYELIVGRRPFRGRTISTLFGQILEQAPEPPTLLASWCPRSLEAIVLRCLSKDAEKRFPSMAEVEQALLAVRDEMRPTMPIPLAPKPKSEPVDMVALADQVAELMGSEGAGPRVSQIDPGRALADLDRALERGALDDAATLLAYVERHQGAGASGVVTRRRRLEQLRRQERDARVRDCLTRARGLLAIDQLEAALSELERAVELNPLDESLVRLRDQVRDRNNPPPAPALEEQRRVAEAAAERGDWVVAEAALRAAEQRHGRAALVQERSVIESRRGSSLDDQLSLEVARAEGLIRDGALREAFDRLRAVLEVAPAHAGAQAALDRARAAVAEPHERLTGEAALLEVSRIITAGAPLSGRQPRPAWWRVVSENRLLVVLLAISLLVLIAALVAVFGPKG